MRGKILYTAQFTVFLPHSRIKYINKMQVNHAVVATHMRLIIKRDYFQWKIEKFL